MKSCICQGYDKYAEPEPLSGRLCLRDILGNRGRGGGQFDSRAMRTPRPGHSGWTWRLEHVQPKYYPCKVRAFNNM